MRSVQFDDEQTTRLTPGCSASRLPPPEPCRMQPWPPLGSQHGHGLAFCPPVVPKPSVQKTMAVPPAPPWLEDAATIVSCRALPYEATRSYPITRRRLAKSERDRYPRRHVVASAPAPWAFQSALPTDRSHKPPSGAGWLREIQLTASRNAVAPAPDCSPAAATTGPNAMIRRAPQL